MAKQAWERGDRPGAWREKAPTWVPAGLLMWLLLVAGCAPRTVMVSSDGEAPMIRLLGPVDLVPLADDPDGAGLVVLLEVVNDRKSPVVVDLEHLLIEQRTPEGARVIVTGRSAAPLYIPGARFDRDGKPLPLTMRHTLRIDRHSWVPDMLDALRTGELFLIGHARATVGRQTRERDFVVQLEPPVFPWHDPEERAGLFGGFRSLKLAFRDLETLEFDAVVMLRDPVGSSLLLSDATAIIDTEGLEKGLTIRLPHISLKGLPHQQEVRIRGTVGLRDCDPTVLDRLAASAGTLRLRIRATASGDGLPQTRIDEILPLDLKASGSMAQRFGVPIELAPLPADTSAAMFEDVDLADLAHLEISEREKLLAGETIVYPVRVRNPFPGTISVRVVRLRIEGPERFTQAGVPLTPLRVELVTGSSSEVQVPPFGEASLPLRVGLTETAVGGSGHFFTKLLAGSDFRGYRITEDVEIGVPLLGRIGVTFQHEVMP